MVWLEKINCRKLSLKFHGYKERSSLLFAPRNTLTTNSFSFQAALHSRSDGDGKCTVNSRQSQTSQTDLSAIEEEDVELGVAEMQRSTIETQTSQSPSSFVREVPCSHYVVDLSIPRRDYVINYNSNSRHDPPPPYSEM